MRDEMCVWLAFLHLWVGTFIEAHASSPSPAPNLPFPFLFGGAFIEAIATIRA